MVRAHEGPSTAKDQRHRQHRVDDVGPHPEQRDQRTCERVNEITSKTSRHESSAVLAFSMLCHIRRQQEVARCYARTDARCQSCHECRSQQKLFVHFALKPVPAMYWIALDELV